MQELLQPTKERGRGVKKKAPTKLVAAAQDDVEADDGEEENEVGAFPLRSVGESTVVNTMELPNFQIDQATSLLQVNGGSGHQKLSIATFLKTCKTWIMEL